jgi:hypothetical protein
VIAWSCGKSWKWLDWPRCRWNCIWLDPEMNCKAVYCTVITSLVIYSFLGNKPTLGLEFMFMAIRKEKEHLHIVNTRCICEIAGPGRALLFFWDRCVMTRHSKRDLPGCKNGGWRVAQTKVRRSPSSCDSPLAQATRVFSRWAQRSISIRSTDQC